MKMSPAPRPGMARHIVIFLCLLPMAACVPVGTLPDAEVVLSVSQRTHRVSPHPCADRFIPH